ncbi:hypothetical protein [Paenibacillus sp. Y412MC10]|uniref:hypothetical protein n=1 Tax=Geobacillus sp. (strain Y412MC10) TaxID=481743 RepID=UPI0011A2A793|nr:hypothetical protein [Paenibacillus sp. Y412MC10]
MKYIFTEISIPKELEEPQQPRADFIGRSCYELEFSGSFQLASKAGFRTVSAQWRNRVGEVFSGVR